MKTCELYEYKPLDEVWFSDHLESCEKCSQYFMEQTKISSKMNSVSGNSDYFSAMNSNVIQKINSGKISKPNSGWMTAASVAAVFLIAYIFTVNSGNSDAEITDLTMTSPDLVNYFQLDSYHQLLDNTDQSELSILLESINGDEELPALQTEPDFTDQEIDQIYQEEFKIRSDKKI